MVMKPDENDVVQNVRRHIATIGNSELTIRAKSEDLQDLWQQKQQLLKEMNAAKIAAAEKAAQPFLEKIQEVDQLYASFLSLLSDY
jgi:hypothetical protein